MEGQRLKPRCVTEVQVGVRVARHRYQLRQAHIELRIRQHNEVRLKAVHRLLKLTPGEVRKEIRVQFRQVRGNKTQVLRPAVDGGRLCSQKERRQSQEEQASPHFSR